MKRMDSEVQWNEERLFEHMIDVILYIPEARHMRVDRNYYLHCGQEGPKLVNEQRETLAHESQLPTLSFMRKTTAYLGPERGLISLWSK
jgi:hypothetical protein